MDEDLLLQDVLLRNMGAAEIWLLLQSIIGIPQGGCLYLMADQGNDLGVENLDL